MRSFRLFFEFIQLFLGVGILSSAFALPAIGVALFFSPRAAAELVIALAVIPLMLLFLLSEWGVLRLFGGQVPRTHGLRNSYEMARVASGEAPKIRPALVTFADPVPDIFVIRAIGGDGLILLSDGLISLLDERELRFVLMRAIRHLATGEVVLQSACVFSLALLRGRRSAGVFYEMSPNGSSRTLSPTLALKALLLYPWLLFFTHLARATVTRRVARGEALESSSELIRSEFKLSRVGRLYGQPSPLPGLVYLGIGR